MNPIRSLLAVHARRLEKAEQRLAEARAALKSRIEEEQQIEADLAAHRVTAAEREREIYRQLFGQIVKRDTLDLAKEEVMALKRKEISLEETLAHAMRATVDATAVAEQAQRAYLRQAARTEKYREIDRRFAELARAAFERKEETEMEEVTMGIRK